MPRGGLELHPLLQLRHGVCVGAHCTVWGFVSQEAGGLYVF